MKTCSLFEVTDGQPGDLLELSFVGDDHQFGLTDGGTRLHVAGRAIIYPAHPLPPYPWKSLDWTVSAGGYRLVIEDGAITGLTYDEWPYPWGDSRYGYLPPAWPDVPGYQHASYLWGGGSQ